MASKKKYLILAIALMAILVASLACSPSGGSAPVETSPLDDALASGRPTLVGFVGDECACSDMRPILEELATEYDGRCNILMLEAMNHKDIASQYQIILTPTLVFFDSGGQETLKHVGAWPKWAVVMQFEEMGIV